MVGRDSAKISDNLRGIHAACPEDGSTDPLCGLRGLAETQKMSAEQRRKRILIVGVGLMLLALFSYVATLDESDPTALPESMEQMNEGVP
jgi:hypothetical protein